MKKLFVSLPMSGRTTDDILAEREELIKAAEETLGQKLDPIQSFFDMESDENASSALSALGRSIQYLALADYVIFSKNWACARGCRIEWLCSRDYGIKTLTFTHFTSKSEGEWIEV